MKTAFLFNGIGSDEERILEYIPEKLKEAFLFEKNNVLAELGYPEENPASKKKSDWISCAVSSVIVYNQLIDNGIYPDYVTGYSMGNINLCGCLGCIDMIDVYRFICIAAECTDDAKKSGHFFDLGMIIGLNEFQVNNIIKACNLSSKVVIGSVNTEFCIMISGYADAVAIVLEECHKEGALNTRKLNVDGAFHYPGFHEYVKKNDDFISGLHFEESFIPIVSAFDQRIIKAPEELYKENRQNLYSSMRWDKTIEKLEELGVTDFYDMSVDGTIKKLSKFKNKTSKMHTISGIVKKYTEVLIK